MSNASNKKTQTKWTGARTGPTVIGVVLLACLGACATSKHYIEDESDQEDGESDIDTDIDSDADTDSNSDVDTDTGNGACDPPAGVPLWGGACTLGSNECPPDTACLQVTSDSQEISTTHGICSPVCCEYGAADPKYCTDISGGTEGCVLINPLVENPFRCAIACLDDAECVEGTRCFPVSVSVDILRICYPPKENAPVYD